MVGEYLYFYFLNISFLSTLNSREYDLRFIYAACCIACLLEDWSGINKEKAVEFIERCQNSDYAYGFVPDGESHGKTSDIMF